MRLGTRVTSVDASRLMSYLEGKSELNEKWTVLPTNEITTTTTVVGKSGNFSREKEMDRRNVGLDVENVLVGCVKTLDGSSLWLYFIRS